MNTESQSENKFLSIFENSLNAILLGTPEGAVLEANNAAVEMFGYSLNELRALGRGPIFDHTDTKMIAALEKRKKDGKVKGEIVGIRRNGERFPIEFTSVIFKSESGELRTSTVLNDITQRRKTENEIALLLSNTEESFILLNKSLQIISFNKSYGDRYKALLNKEVKKGDHIIDYVQPERKLIVEDIYKRVLNGETIKDEIIILSPNHGEFIFSSYYKPARDNKGEIIGAFITMRDVTEERKAMQMIVANEKQEQHRLKLLESVITNTKDSVMITEAEPFAEPGPKIVYVNDAFKKMTGYDASEVIGKSPRILQGKNTNREELKRLSDSMRKWKSCEVTIINYKKNGEEFWINFSVTPVADEKGWYTHWIAIERDVTHIKQGELEREQIISELSQINMDLKQFSYVTSHNLRSPIANLLGLTSLISQYDITDQSLTQILDGIRQSALMFDDTVKDLTSILIVKDQKNIVKERISIVTVIDKITKQLNLTQHQDLKIKYDFGVEPFVFFAKAYMESILLNLFTNAIKYKSSKRKLEVNVSLQDAEDSIILKFRDNGIGVDTEMHKEKLFKLYQRFHNQSEGKGLGLYLIKTQLEALGGTIEIESEVDVGTTFILKFKK